MYRGRKIQKGEAERLMRRTDREVTDKKEIMDILWRCSTLRIGMKGEPYPYVVPVSFGLDTAGDKPVIYFHCAREGQKLDMLQADPHVCVEGDIFIKTELIKHGITARYESVIGFGVCELVDSPEEIRKGLLLLNEHYGYGDFQLDKCGSLDKLAVGKITLESVTGKRNLPR